MIVFIATVYEFVVELLFTKKNFRMNFLLVPNQITIKRNEFGGLLCRHAKVE